MKKQSKKDQMDESLSVKHGKESEKKQSFADRRHESMGEKCKMGMKVKVASKGK